LQEASARSKSLRFSDQLLLYSAKQKSDEKNIESEQPDLYVPRRPRDLCGE